MAGWGPDWGFGGNWGGAGGAGGGMRMRGGGGWGGGGAPYGYGGGYNRGGGRGGWGGPGGGHGGALTLTEVQGWLDKQQPFVLQNIMKHCSNLLINKHNVPAEDLSDWYKKGTTDEILKTTESDTTVGGEMKKGKNKMTNYDQYTALYCSDLLRVAY